MTNDELQELIAIGMSAGRILQQVRKEDRTRITPMLKRLKNELEQDTKSNVSEFGVRFIDSILTAWNDFELNAKILDHIHPLHLDK